MFIRLITIMMYYCTTYECLLLLKRDLHTCINDDIPICEIAMVIEFLTRSMLTILYVCRKSNDGESIDTFVGEIFR